MTTEVWISTRGRTSEATRISLQEALEEVYATDGSNDKGVMVKLDEHRGGCCQLGRGEEGNSSNRAELGAACLALEDAKRQQDRKPVMM